MQLKIAAGVLALCTLAGCSSTEVLVAHSVDLEPSVDEISEQALLDVAVVVFDPGVPDGEISREILEELVDEGTFVQIRRTESLYFAVALRETLRRSNHWGSVWVTPEATRASDLNVAASILHSDGETAEVHVLATDASGRVWIDKDYSIEVPGGAYNRSRYGGLDPYQDMFNEIANDLAAFRTTLNEDETIRLREIAALRYAEELSPEAFTGYVTEERDGSFTLARLPAVDDPQFNRTQRARQRERVFFDTLDSHYMNFARDASDPYDSWRQYSREETIQVREITRSARFRTGMGIASILASFVYGNNSSNDGFSDRVIRDTMMYIGMDMLRTSASRRQEKRIHVETLEELSASFDDEVEPLVVEVAGTQRRLTGTAEVQYEEWKELLRELYITETGFEADEVEIFVEEPEALSAPAEELVPAAAPPAASETPSADNADTTEAVDSGTGA
jgi:hypothetical protein